MRILMTADTVGGVWTYTRELAAGLLDEGCEIILITLGGEPSPEQRSWIDQTRFRWPRAFRALTTAYPLEWMQNNENAYAASMEFLLRCVRQYSPDLLHSNQFCYGALPVAIPRVVVAHSDVLSWWRNCRGGTPEPSPWIDNYVQMVCRGLHGADMVVAPTAWMLQQIDTGYGPFRSSAVIANGRNIDRIPQRPRALQAVTAGRLWDEAKNVELLAAVDTRMPMFVAGDDTFEGSRSSLADREFPRSLGRLTESDLLRLFAESAIYVVTSRYEPFGLAAVEAALAGCAIVANDIPPLREVWGDSAIYFHRNSAESLSRTLDQLAVDPASMHAAAVRAERRARSRFSGERMTADYLALYSRLLCSEGRRRAA